MATIIVADDDIAAKEFLTLALEADGHEVHCVANGLEAYELTLALKPGMVFLDVSMPVFDGFEACEMMRNDPEVPDALPIILLSSSAMDSRRLESVGATDRLPKPHLVVGLRDLLAKYLGAEARA